VKQALRATPVDRRPDVSVATVGVLSFNIRHCEGVDGVLDVERIARVIRRSGAEIVGLQEVDRHFGERSQWEDQATELGRMLGYHVAYGVNQDLDPPAPGRPRAQYGTAVLSCYPIVQWGNTLLFRSPGAEQRGLLHAEIDVRGVSLHVFTTHLDFFSEFDRRQQAEEIVELIGDAGPTVLLGDFNATPGTSVIETVGAAFQDSWSALGRRTVATFPADAPERCIDYIFASCGATPVSIDLVLDEPTASDHLPVLGRYAIATPIPSPCVRSVEWSR
jgi:endonuclease/exonuclease/phosphatase family metal-dependent hydrolase